MLIVVINSDLVSRSGGMFLPAGWADHTADDSGLWHHDPVEFTRQNNAAFNSGLGDLTGRGALTRAGPNPARQSALA